jgi:hypothetical protein
MADNIYDAILKQIADYQPTLQRVVRQMRGDG